MVRVQKSMSSKDCVNLTSPQTFLTDLLLLTLTQAVKMAR